MVQSEDVGNSNWSKKPETAVIYEGYRNVVTVEKYISGSVALLLS